MFQIIAMSKGNNNNNNNNVAEEATFHSKLPKESKDDLVAKWYIPLFDKDHVVEFEHGTTTGKRVVTVNGKVCLFLFMWELVEVIITYIFCLRVYRRLLVGNGCFVWLEMNALPWLQNIIA